VRTAAPISPRFRPAHPTMAVSPRRQAQISPSRTVGRCPMGRSERVLQPVDVVPDRGSSLPDLRPPRPAGRDRPGARRARPPSRRPEGASRSGRATIRRRVLMMGSGLGRRPPPAVGGRSASPIPNRAARSRSREGPDRRWRGQLPGRGARQSLRPRPARPEGSRAGRCPPLPGGRSSRHRPGAGRPGDPERPDEVGADHRNLRPDDNGMAAEADDRGDRQASIRRARGRRSGWS
jgi:hypothetical protein